MIKGDVEFGKASIVATAGVGGGVGVGSIVTVECAAAGGGLTDFGPGEGWCVGVGGGWFVLLEGDCFSGGGFLLLLLLLLLFGVGSGLWYTRGERYDNGIGCVGYRIYLNSHVFGRCQLFRIRVGGSYCQWCYFHLGFTVTLVFNVVYLTLRFSFGTTTTSTGACIISIFPCTLLLLGAIT